MMIASGADIRRSPRPWASVDHHPLGRYGHLLPGSVRELGAKMDAYLEGRAG